MIVFAIETSCDETAAAVYDAENKKVLSSTLFSQIELHKLYGGVVPEIASRSHVEKIRPIVQQALDQANCTLNDIDVIAVTNKPGLPGSLLVGLCFAKALAYAKNKKIIGVNHLEAHAFSAHIEHDVPFPHLCLTASGGHTSLYIVENYGDYQEVGTTLDDAAGECFDKIAKLINLGYPGGPIIEKLAQQADFKDFYNYPRLKDKKSLNFSFSGLKTAVLYDLVNRGYYDLQNKKYLYPDNQEIQRQVASSLLVAVTDIFKQRLKQAFSLYPQTKAFTFAGGVACNSYIRTELEKLCTHYGKQFFAPSRKYCTDNAAMIAFVGAYKAKENKFDDLSLDIY